MVAASVVCWNEWRAFCQAPMRSCAVFSPYGILKPGEPIEHKEVGDTATLSRAVLETVPYHWFDQGILTLQTDGASGFTLDVEARTAQAGQALTDNNGRINSGHFFCVGEA